jgi:NRAMP (natural resistance-associated macrophage protein)-like metal ion transporter
MLNIIRTFFRRAGPGLITGAADDDPSGIATYSQTGAQFGYGQLWTALWMLPMLIAIQEASARIGAVTGKGIAAVVKQYYSKKILYPVVCLVLVANIINIGADIGAMAAAACLIVPLSVTPVILFFTAVILVLQIFVSYKRYSSILKWLCLFLIAYPATVFLVKQPWLTLLKATLMPHVEFNFDFLFIITGVLGTTISPYLFFWQASQTVEEQKNNQHTLVVSKKDILHMRIDNFVGMVFSEICTWSIIVVAATVLHGNGVTDIKSAADAAKALVPFVQGFPHAGFIAECIFAVGIIGLGLLSVPVLAGSAAYAIAEAFDWKKGLDLKFRNATGFYGVIIVATMIGLSINFIGINPFKALVYCAVINGVAAVPLIFIIALTVRNKKIMGRFKSGWLSTIFVWLTFLGMFVSAFALFFTFGKS